MKCQDRNGTLGQVCTTLVLLTSLACGDDNISPVAPTPVAQQEEAGGTAGASAGDTVELKATLAVPIDPDNDIEIDDFTPTLTASNATGLFVTAATFQHSFSIYQVNNTGRIEVEVGNGVPRDAESTVVYD